VTKTFIALNSHDNKQTNAKDFTYEEFGHNKLAHIPLNYKTIFTGGKQITHAKGIQGSFRSMDAFLAYTKIITIRT
jgi:hypothetical protein